jgi:hypothetical protein
MSIGWADLKAGLPEFGKMPSIVRLSREMIITEKIDGTNASVTVTAEGRVVAGKRSGYIFDPNDNMGFPGWVEAHRDELLALGPGCHFGEWWGWKIQRGYGLAKDERRFSLFNVRRWGDDVPESVDGSPTRRRPACCHVVPMLFRGPFETDGVYAVMGALMRNGSAASPGYMRPEGVVVFHNAGDGYLFKKTFEKDTEGKGS